MKDGIANIPIVFDLNKLTFASLKDFNVSRQSPNSSGRKGTVEGPCRLQTGDRRKVWREILHHFAGWQGCSSVSLRGMGADRSQAEWAFELQSGEEAVFDCDELLRSGGGNGRSGAFVVAPVTA